MKRKTIKLPAKTDQAVNRPAPSVRICTPTYRTMDPACKASLFSLQALKGIEIDAREQRGYSVIINRNCLAKSVDKDLVMWLDSDISFTPAQFKNLYDRVNAEKDLCLVSGVYEKNGAPGIANVDDGVSLNSKEYRDAERVGLGFCIHRRELLDKIEWPFFGHEPDFEKRDFGEDDTFFCKRIRDAGYKIKVDFNIRVQHDSVSTEMPVFLPGKLWGAVLHAMTKAPIPFDVSAPIISSITKQIPGLGRQNAPGQAPPPQAA